MEFLGINGAEALVLALLALVIFGPRQAVELIGKIRTFWSGILAFSSRLRTSLAEEAHIASAPEQASLNGELEEWAHMASALATSHEPAPFAEQEAFPSPPLSTPATHTKG